MLFTQRLLLRKPEGTDPFLRSDFNTNYDTLDSAPGIFICTSTTNPSWGAGQSGRTILETDTGRIKRWNGSAWLNPSVPAVVWDGRSSSTINQANNTNISYNIASISVPYAGKLTIWVKCDWVLNVGEFQGITLRPRIDTTNVGDSSVSQQYAPSHTTSQTVQGYGSLSVAAGSHNIGLNIIVGTGGATISLTQRSFIAILSQ